MAKTVKKEIAEKEYPTKLRPIGLCVEIKDLPIPEKSGYYNDIKNKIQDLVSGKCMQVTIADDDNISYVQKRISSIVYNHKIKLKDVEDKQFIIKAIDKKTIGVWRTL